MNETVYYLADEGNKELVRVPNWSLLIKPQQILEYSGVAYIVCRVRNIVTTEKRRTEVYVINLDNVPRHTLTVSF